MTSVVIPAHNEAAVIGRCLDLLLADPTATAAPGARRRPALDITVIANGCADSTAAIARARPGVRVIEVPEAGKAAALNAGDGHAVGWPRIYLDADIGLSATDVCRLAAAVTTGPALAAAPRRRVVTAGRPLLVRAYYAIHCRLPVFRGALFGRGAVAISEAGRRRFDRFPDVLGDDLFLDSQFHAHEKREVAQVVSAVAAPWRIRDLVRRLARVRAGNAALRARLPGQRPAARTAWLRQVVLPRPWLAPAAVGYVAVTLAACLRARRRPAEWGRDGSTRITSTEGAGIG